MRYEDVVAKLRLVSQSGRSIRLVVARIVSNRVEEESGVLPEITDVRRRLTMLGYDVYETRERVTYTCVAKSSMATCVQVLELKCSTRTL